MGWDFFCDPICNKDYLIADLLKPFEGETNTYRILDHAVVGGELWRVVEVTEAGGKVWRTIWRDLIRGGGKGSGWGHKDVPYHEGLSCPKRLIDMVLPDEDDERDLLWRIQVAEERHGKRERAKRLKNLIRGQKVRIYGKDYTVVGRHHKRGWLVRQDDNQQMYRATKDIEVL